MTAAIDLRGVRKVFGDFTALHQVSFEIADNEFFTLLGPSGCGKTTLLRMIAGFEMPTAGEVYVYGQEVEGLPPHKRPVNTVFQNYALFPHMTVTENVGFGLQMLGWAKGDIHGRVREVLAQVKLEEFAARKPSQLSGGQQQRVALARAMAPRPKVLLLDEPLSALDLKLRQAMRGELKALQRETGITFVFVTHDQEEALTMSDRIAVMSAGQVQQIGTPEAVYGAPANRFVAEFIGEINTIPVTVIDEDVEGRVICEGPGGTRVAVEGDARQGAEVTLAVRPERMILRVDSSEGFAGRVVARQFLGTDWQYNVALDHGPDVSVRVQVGQMVEVAEGAEVRVGVDGRAAQVLEG